MEKSWKPGTAGILCIIAGILGLIIGIGIELLGGIAGAVIQQLHVTIPGLSGLVGGLIAGIGIVELVFGVVAILGGVFALRRRVWGLALAGSICATFVIWVLGIPAIIFTALARDEFE